MSVGRAPGKVILFGEHAVVYGRPAIAVPVFEVQAEATVEAGKGRQGVLVQAQDLDRTFYLDEAPEDDPLRLTILNALGSLKVAPAPDIVLTIRSKVPIARGLGSGAAVATAVVRGLTEYFNGYLSSREISDLVFETEKLHHGTPSGIDNTVVAFGKPVYFIRGQRLEVFWVRRSFALVIADTGIASSTRSVVESVRQGWSEDPDRFDKLFDEIGRAAQEARWAIEAGRVAELGRLMDKNHELLQEIGVSCPELEMASPGSSDAPASRSGWLGGDGA